MSPAFNGSSVSQCFECSNATEIHNRVMFDFYLQLSFSYWWPISVHSLNRLTNANLLLTSSNSISTQKEEGVGGKWGRERMKEGIVFTFLWLTIFTQEERVNSGRRGKGKGKGGEGKMEGREERLLYSHFCGWPSSWVGVLWTPSLHMSHSEMASQASWLPPSPLVLCPWQSWRKKREKHVSFHFQRKVHTWRTSHLPRKR